MSFYKNDLIHQVQAIVELYQQDREKHWYNCGEDEKIFFEKSERFAEVIQKESRSFFSSGKIDDDIKTLRYELSKLCFFKNLNIESEYNRIWDVEGDLDGKIQKIKELFLVMPDDAKDNNSPLRLTWEKLCIDYAWHLTDQIEECAKRALDLYKLVTTTKPSDPTLAFLLRLSRCYIMGYDNECVILSRSVIDSAFRDVIVDPSHDNLSKRINAAYERELIDKNTKRLSHEIKERGNKAVHLQPNITTDVIGNIENTIIVLENLYKSVL